MRCSISDRSGRTVLERRSLVCYKGSFQSSQPVLSGGVPRPQICDACRPCLEPRGSLSWISSRHSIDTSHGVQHCELARRVFFFGPVPPKLQHKHATRTMWWSWVDGHGSSSRLARLFVQSSLAIISDFGIGVKLSISSPRAASTGLMCGGTSS